MLNITCPHCQAVIEVPENYLGEKVQCPYCEGKFIIEGDVVQSNANHSTPSKQQPPPNRGQNRRKGLFLTILVMVIFLCAGVGGALALVKFFKSEKHSLLSSNTIASTDTQISTQPLEISGIREPAAARFELLSGKVETQLDELEKRLSEAVRNSRNPLSLTDESAFRNDLNRRRIIVSVKPETLENLLAKPEGPLFLNAFFNDPEWMNAFLESGSVNNPSRALELLQLVWKHDPQKRCASNPILRNLATACALNGSDDYDTVRFYQVYTRNFDLGLLHASFDDLTAEEMRFLVTPDKTTPEATEYLIAHHNTPAETYGGTCWYAAYLSQNAFGESIHGSNYYKPWDHAYVRHEASRKVGGVCGSLSHYGSAAAKAAGIPSTPGGQPGHCAYMVRSLDGVWRIHYYVGGPTGTHYSFWGIYGYSALPLIESVFSDRDALERSDALASTAELVRGLKNRPSARLRISEARLYALQNERKLPDFSKLTPLKRFKTSSFDLSQAGRNDKFALVWNGKVEGEPGKNVELQLDSDDGSKLYLNGELQIDIDGPRGTGNPKSVKITLPASGQTPFELQYMQLGGDKGLLFQTVQPPERYDPQVNTFYESALDIHPVNYPLWETYGKYLSSAQGVPAEVWGAFTERLIKGLASHQDAAWGLLERFAVPAARAGKGDDGVLELLMKGHSLLKQYQGPELAEAIVFERILERHAQLLNNDKTKLIRLFDTALKSHYGYAQNFSAVMNWGSSLFLKDPAYSSRFLTVLEQNLEGKSGGVGAFLRNAVREASESGKVNLFQQLCNLQDKLNNLPPAGRGNVKFSSPLLSDKGLLQISSTSNWDNPEQYRKVIDGGPEGAFHTAKESNPWAVVTLPGEAVIDAIYLKNVGTQNNQREVPLRVSVSEDKVKWQTVFESDRADDEWKIDLSGKKIKAKYIKAERAGGVKDDFFHLRKFQIHGQKRY